MEPMEVIERGTHSLKRQVGPKKSHSLLFLTIKMGKQGPKKGHVGVWTYEEDATLIAWILVM